MKFFKIIFLSSFLLIYFNIGYGQAIIKFDQTNFDFGQVAEGSQATHEFRFVNEGNSPLIINKVQASCGCTTPFWTKDPIKPGEEGVITASYNSKGRPGSFNKSITINSNATEPTTRVFIKGIVVPVDQAGVIYTPEQLENSPRAMVANKVVNIGKVEADQTVPVEITVENTGKSNLIISELRSGCNCIKISPESQSVVQPGQRGRIQLTFRPRSIGKKAETAVLLTNDLKSPEKKIILHAEVVESLTNTSILKENNSGFTF